jgi:hypothetical protein
VLIATPGVDGITPGRKAAFLDGLAKPKVRFSVVCSQFDKKIRLNGNDEISSEW